MADRCSNSIYSSIGIRIGLDAVDRLNVQSRDLDVIYYNEASAPCPCVVDGVMIATVATPGQSSSLNRKV